MAYATQSDIENVVAPQVVAHVADDDGDGQADPAVIAKAIEQADALIDSYCGGRYPTPFDPVPGAVTRASAVLAAYELMARKGFIGGEGDQAIVRLQRDTMQWLRDVGAGKAQIPVTGQTPEPPDSGVAVCTRPQTFTEEGLKGY